MLRIALALALALPTVAAAQDLDSLRDAARSNRRDYDAQRAYGIALMRAGEFREADQVLRAASRLRRDSLEALYDVARVAFAQEDYRKSRAACRLLERESRSAVLTHVCRARAFLVWNRAGRAFEELEAALAAEGDHFEALLALGDAHRLRAAVSEAEDAYQRAIAVHSDRPEPHYGLGLLYKNARRNPQAIAALRRAMALDGDDPDVLYELATLLRGDEAKALLTRVVALRPRNAAALVALADAEREAGELDQAVERFRAVLEIDDRSAAAHRGLGLALLAQGNPEAAAEPLNRSLELVPNQPRVVLALGEMHEAAGRTQDAFNQYRHANDLDPRNPEGLLKAAALALRLDRDVLATGFLDRVLQVHRNNAQALFLYGKAMAARRDRAAARQYYQRALSGEGEVDRAEVQAAIRELDGAQPQGRTIRRATAGGR